jgi:hypothetical protein
MTTFLGLSARPEWPPQTPSETIRCPAKFGIIPCGREKGHAGSHLACVPSAGTVDGIRYSWLGDYEFKDVEEP